MAKQVESAEEQAVLRELSRFHGHLGPYVVVGYRMGVVANAELSQDPFAKRAVVRTGIGPPLSCIVDGIQFSSGCTLGKGNLDVSHEERPEALFTMKDTSITVRLRDAVHRRIREMSRENMEQLACELMRMEGHELFVTERS